MAYLMLSGAENTKLTRLSFRRGSSTGRCCVLWLHDTQMQHLIIEDCFSDWIHPTQKGGLQVLQGFGYYCV